MHSTSTRTKPASTERDETILAKVPSWAQEVLLDPDGMVRHYLRTATSNEIERWIKIEGSGASAGLVAHEQKVAALLTLAHEGTRDQPIMDLVVDAARYGYPVYPGSSRVIIAALYALGSLLPKLDPNCAARKQVNWLVRIYSEHTDQTKPECLMAKWVGDQLAAKR